MGSSEAAHLGPVRLSGDEKVVQMSRATPPSPDPKHSAEPAQKGVICECLRCPEAVVCVTECVSVTLCVMTVNESSTTPNMTLAIYDIKLDGHRPNAAKRSVSCSNPALLTLGTDT